MESETLELHVTASDAGAGRLDRFLSQRLPSLSRARIQQLIREGHILVNGQVARPRDAVVSGQQIAVYIPKPPTSALVPEGMELSVLFEDDDLIVVDKASGLIVHPGSGHESGTLVNGLLHHCGGKLSRLADEDRPGIVHRLDRDTSGCLVAAKSDRAYRTLVEQFSSRLTTKHYLCVVNGVPDSLGGRIENRIGRHPVRRQQMTVLPPPAGKEALTDYEVIWQPEKPSQPKSNRWCLLRCRLLTGRTHQIRVHCKESLSCPILGDSVYGKPSRDAVPVERLMLHAHELAFEHPDGRRLQFTATPPSAFDPFLPKDLSDSRPMRVDR